MEEAVMRFKIINYYSALKKEMDDFIFSMRMEETHTEWDSYSKEDKIEIMSEIIKLPRYIALKTMLATVEQLAEKCEIHLDTWELSIF